VVVVVVVVVLLLLLPPQGATWTQLSPSASAYMPKGSYCASAVVAAAAATTAAATPMPHPARGPRAQVCRSQAFGRAGRRRPRPL